MKHKQDAIKAATNIINSHLANGCTPELAQSCAITTVRIMVNIGLYPMSKSLYQRALNYLTKDIPKATIEEIEKDGELVNSYSVEEYEEEEAGFVNVYHYLDQSYHIVTWQAHSSKKGKEIFKIY